MREDVTIPATTFTRLSRFGFVNAYLVHEDDGSTLVDTMLPRSGKRIRAAAEAAGSPIRRILLTHAHMDHIGSLDELAAALPDAEVLIGTREARLLGKDLSLDPGEPQVELRGGYPGAQARVTRTLDVDDRVGSLRVVAAPGHTPGQIALFDTRDGTLYCGDAYSTLGGVETSARTSLRFPFAAMATWHRPTALETARRLRALEPARLAPGHGRVVEAPLAAMDDAIVRAE